MKIAVVGDFGVDNYVNLNLYKPGGIAFNVGYNLAKSSDFQVSLMSVIGDDSFGKKLKAVVDEFNIDASHIEVVNGKSAVQKIELIEGERKFLGYDPGVLKQWELSQDDMDFIGQHDFVYVPLSDGMEQIFEKIESLKSVSKVADFSQDYELADFDEEVNLMTKHSVFFDLIFFGGSIENKKMMKKLAKNYPEKIFVLTMGGDGAIAFQGNNENFVQAKKTKVVDTTGCGDAFQAAFIISYLKSKNVAEAMEFATLCASKKIGNIGSTNLELHI